MGFDGKNQKLEFGMVKQYSNRKNQRDCDMIRATSNGEYFSTNGPNSR